MHPHHTESIERVRSYFEAIPGIQALLLTGSIAHGFESAASDIDVMIIVSEKDHTERLSNGHLQFFSRDLVTYPEGYVDGKYTSLSFLTQVAEHGSEPARFAFSGAKVLFTRVDGLDTLLKRIAVYPRDQKVQRIRRFYAQFEAWNWYAGEALRLQNRYLLGLSVAKLVLFGGRLILAHNELLYPYHKWFLRVLADAPRKPGDMMQRIAALTENADAESVTGFFECVRGYREWEISETGWPNQFMTDSELNWMSGLTPVDDI